MNYRYDIFYPKTNIFSFEHLPYLSNKHTTKNNIIKNEEKKNGSIELDIENLCDYFDHTDVLDDYDNLLNKINKKYDEQQKDFNDKCCGAKLIENINMGCMFCTQCGRKYEALLDNKLINQIDSNDIKNNNMYTAANFFFPKSSISTKITGPCDGRIKRAYYWSSTPYNEKSLSKDFEYITHICDKMKINKMIIDDVKILIKKINETTHLEGKNKGKKIITRADNKKSILAACVYKACIKAKQPREVKEIASYFNLNKTLITNGCNKFEDLMSKNEINNTNHLLISPFDYIKRHEKKLGFTEKHFTIIKKILKNKEKYSIINEPTAISFAAGLTFLMSKLFNMEITKKDIHLIFDISEVTISKVYKNIFKHQNKLIENIDI